MRMTPEERLLRAVHDVAGPMGAAARLRLDGAVSEFRASVAARERERLAASFRGATLLSRDRVAALIRSGGDGCSPTDADSRASGQVACALGFPRDANPFEDHRLRTSWDAGWAQGDGKRASP